MPPKKGGKSGRGKKGAGKSRKGGEGVSTVSSKAGCKGKSAKSTPPSRSPSIERDEISNIEEDLAELIDQEMTKSPRASDMEDSPPQHDTAFGEAPDNLQEAEVEEEEEEENDGDIDKVLDALRLAISALPPHHQRKLLTPFQSYGVSNMSVVRTEPTNAMRIPNYVCQRCKKRAGEVRCESFKYFNSSRVNSPCSSRALFQTRERARISLK